MVNRCKIIPHSLQFKSNSNLRLSPCEMVFNQKPRNPIMFTANTQCYCHSTKEPIFYNLPLHTHDKNHFHLP